MSDRIKNLASRLGWLLSTSGGSPTSVTGGDAYNYKNTQLLKEGKVDEARASQAKDDKIGAIATGASIMLPAVLTNLTTSAPVLKSVLTPQKVVNIGSSIIGGDLIDKMSKKTTGNSFGYNVANLAGLTNNYNGNMFIKFAFDSLNPGYYMGGLVQKGLSIPLGGLKRFTINPKGYLNVPQTVTSIGEKAPFNLINITNTNKPFAGGAESNVFDLGNNVLKTSKKHVDIPIAIKQINWTNFKNTYPGFLKQSYIGYSDKSPSQVKLFFTQPKAKVFKDDIQNLLLPHRMKNLGYIRVPGKGLFANGVYVDTKTGNALYDVGARNVGKLNGKFKIIDAMPYSKTFNVEFNPAFIEPKIDVASSIIGNALSQKQGGILKSQLGDTLPEIPQPSYMPQMPNNIDWVWKPNPNIKFTYDPNVLINAGLMPVKKFFGKTVLDVRSDGRRRDRVINRIGAYSNLTRGKKTIVVNNGGEIKQS